MANSLSFNIGMSVAGGRRLQAMAASRRLPSGSMSSCVRLQRRAGLVIRAAPAASRIIFGCDLGHSIIVTILHQ
jgi:hypothetical protein